MIYFNCPKCGQEHSAAEKYAGKSATCSCGEKVQIPKLNKFKAERVEPIQNSMQTWLPTVLASVAIIISLLAYIHDPLGSGIDSYDFKTPKESYLSYLKIEVASDLRASIDLGRLTNLKQRKEKLKTIKFHRDAEWQGKKLFFISFEEKGFIKYQVVALEKDADTGYWITAYFSTYSMEEDKDKKLKAQIVKWREKTATD